MLDSLFRSARSEEKCALVRAVNRVVHSPVGVLLLAALTMLAHALSLEFEFYLFVIVYAIYVALFANDLSPLMPLFVFCYIVPSQSNNPGKSESSIFYGTSGLILLLAVSVGVFLVFVRIAKDKSMGFDRLFTKKRALLPGMLALGAAYLISGITAAHYSDFALKNLFFAFIQFAAIFLLYFVFTATVNYNKFNMSYLASIGVCTGLIIALELFVLYSSSNVIVNGVIMRDKLYTGWGIYNNLGVMAVMAIPFAFYFVARAKVATPWIITSLALLATAILTCSRGAIVFGIPIFIVCVIIVSLRGQSKTEIRIAYLISLVATAILCILLWDKITTIFASVPSFISGIGRKTLISEETRINLYKNGLDVFSSNPIFGETFYPVTYEIYDFSDIDAFSSFFPPRWHNTVVQILASCGIVGMIAYLFHRVSTVVLFIKKRNRATTFIALSVLALLLMSLVDCHFFNVGPVLFYSTMLAVLECSKNEPF